MFPQTSLAVRKVSFACCWFLLLCSLLCLPQLKAYDYPAVVPLAEEIRVDELESVQQAMRGGDLEALYRLAHAHIHGQIVSRNLAQGLIYLRLAAWRGSTDAQACLGAIAWSPNVLVEGRPLGKKESEFVFTEAAAYQGHPVAQHNLGLMCLSGYRPPSKTLEKWQEMGLVLEIDPEVYNHERDLLCEFWFKKAADQGFANAQYQLAMIYDGLESKGLGNLSRHIGYLQAAASQEFPEAEFRLGRLYLFGKEILPQDTQKGYDLYRRAAAKGHVRAQHCLGILYEKAKTDNNVSLGFQPNFQRAIQWYRSLQNSERRLPQRSGDYRPTMASLYEQGWEGQDPDWEKAYQLRMESYEGAQFPLFETSLLQLANRYRLGQAWPQDFTQAVKFYRQIVDDPSPDKRCFPIAAYRLAQLTLAGQGLAQSDLMAFELLERASEYEHGTSLNFLGYLHELGKGAPRVSKRQAFNYYEQAAEQDLSYVSGREGNYHLGRCFLLGIGTDEDLFQALSCFQKAARRDHPAALYQLGLMYQKGMGVAQDFQQARGLFFHAASLGYPPAHAKLLQNLAKDSVLLSFSESLLQEFTQRTHLKPTLPADELHESWYYLNLSDRGNAFASGSITGKADMKQALYWYQTRSDRKTHFDVIARQAWEAGLADHWQQQEPLDLVFSWIREAGIEKKFDLYGYEQARATLRFEATSPEPELAQIPLIKATQDLPNYRTGSFFIHFTFGKKEIELQSEALLLDGLCHLWGIGRPLTPEQADFGLGNLKRSANCGNPEAYYQLALAHEADAFVISNPELAKHYYWCAARRGHPYAQLALVAQLPLNSSWVKLATKFDEQLKAQNRQRMGLPSEQGYLSWLEAAVQAGSPEALLLLAEAYEQGQRLEKNLAKALELYELGAKRGILRAQYKLGQAYLQGKGLEQDVPRGLEILFQAANQNYAGALHELSLLYRDGVYFPQDLEKSYQLSRQEAKDSYAFVGKRELLDSLYQLYGIATPKQPFWAMRNLQSVNRHGIIAAPPNFANADYYLGWMHLSGELGIVNEYAGLFFLQRAAQRNQPLAQLALLSHASEGSRWHPVLKQLYSNLHSQDSARRLPPTPEQAYERCKQLAREGNCQAQYNLGELYLQGKGTPANREKAIAWLSAAAQQDNLYALAKLGSLRFASPDSDMKSLGIAYLKRAAEKGHLESSQQLGLLYAKGDFLPQDDQQAFDCLSQTEDLANGEIYYYLGSYYLEGKVTTTNPSKGFRLLEWAAKKANFGKAQTRIAYACLYGQGKKKDERRAIRFFKKAANSGQAQAHFQLAQFYQDGFLVKKDEVQSRKHLIQAAELGHPLAFVSLAESYELPAWFEALIEQASPYIREAQEAKIERMRF